MSSSINPFIAKSMPTTLPNRSVPASSVKNEIFFPISKYACPPFSRGYITNAFKN